MLLKHVIEKSLIKVETFGRFYIKLLSTVWGECQTPNSEKNNGKYLAVNDMITHEKVKNKIEDILGSELCEQLNLVKKSKGSYEWKSVYWS